MEADEKTSERTWPRTLVFATIGLGLSLTLNGYVSRDGDQAYRLPLLLHRQNPALFRNDPFVQALDAFNPHTHFLQLLDAASRPFGLSAGLFGLYAATYLLTFVSIDHLARRVWPAFPQSVGLIAAALLFTAKGGNIGTNHLFEPLLLDRLIALAFGWSALALALNRSYRLQALSAMPIGLAAWVHPSLGLQIGLWMIGCWICWAFVERQPRLLIFVPSIGVALLPGLMAVDSSRLFDGLPPQQFRLLTFYVQSPQHMIPRLWRTPQWLAAFCYPLLAFLSRVRNGGLYKATTPRRRLTIALGLIVAGLFLATLAIEGLGDLRVTLIQPFRMATLGRGLCLIFIAPYLLELGRRKDFSGNVGAVWIFVGLLGDWTLVVVTVLLSADSFVGWAKSSQAHHLRSGRLVGLRGSGPPYELIWNTAIFAAGLIFLARHDTESGHVRLLLATAAGFVVWMFVKGRSFPLTNARLLRVACYSWLVPLAALLMPFVRAHDSDEVTRFLIARCRFGETPTHDVERLALWCRDHTPQDAVFIGPPGPKTFRLWSERSLAFNRAGSPYHAAGIADWAARFRDHVGFRGSLDAFAAAYLRDRQSLERRYDLFDAQMLVDLAHRQKADFIITEDATRFDGRLQLLHVEGRYAVYRVAPVVLARSAGTG